jgi:2-polyprenyl-6-methoxyphenol hydroxylase-like FAD-dependent oxidoreductase
VVSTHAILRSGVLQLTRWGLLDRVVDAGTPPIRDITLGFGDERIRFQVKPEHGVDTLYAPRRTVLDGILVDAALDAGAEVEAGAPVVGLLRGDRGEVSGIVASRRGSDLDVSARVVIGADGVWSRTAELVGAHTYESHEPSNAVTYAYFEGVKERGFWFQFTPGVNAGIIPTNDGLSCVFVGRSTSRIPDFRADPEAEFARLLRLAGPDLWERVGGSSRVTGFRGTDGLPGFLRQPWGPGWALVGDAGYTKDPISAHGMSDALRDAELCARAVDRALRAPAEAVVAMTEYQHTRDRLSVGMLRESRALARYGWDAAEASARMRRISDHVRTECEVLESFGQWAPAFSAA